MKYYKVELEKRLSDLFHDIDIKLFNVEENNWKISVFISAFLNQENLLKYWEEISAIIATGYQGNLKKQEDFFEKWNLYVIYTCATPISKDLKSKIENNKFSSRKIVESNFDKEITTEEAERLIIKYITNTDLIDIVNNTSDNIKNDYEPINKEIWKLIPNDNSLFRNADLQERIINQFEIITNED